MLEVGNCGNNHTAEFPTHWTLPTDFEFRPDYPVTADYVELDEISCTQGSDAMVVRSSQMLRMSAAAPPFQA